MEKKKYGSYVMFTVEPDTEKGKAQYIKLAVDRILDQLTAVIIPDWNTLKLTIKEGFDVIGGPDWYEDEKPSYSGPYAGWAMTVGIKIDGEEIENDAGRV